MAATKRQLSSDFDSKEVQFANPVDMVGSSVDLGAGKSAAGKLERHLSKFGNPAFNDEEPLDDAGRRLLPECQEHEDSLAEVEPMQNLYEHVLEALHNHPSLATKFIPDILTNNALTNNALTNNILTNNKYTNQAAGFIPDLLGPSSGGGREIDREGEGLDAPSELKKLFQQVS
jgi:hypothetical protein